MNIGPSFFKLEMLKQEKVFLDIGRIFPLSLRDSPFASYKTFAAKELRDLVTF